MEIYKSTELTNEQYHQEIKAVSGSGLHTIYTKSPAHFKYAESKETEALAIGTAAHAMLLEPEVFNAEYVRGFDVSVYPDALVTANDLKGWLKERGQKVSGSKGELIERIHDLEPLTHIADVLQSRYEQWNAGKESLRPEVYDKIQSMRQTIMQSEDVAAMVNSGHPEMSIVGEFQGVNVKVRPDLITSNGGLVNYKTTTDVHPERFGKKAFDYGYLLKAALEYDMFKAAYGQAPVFYVLLAQEKEAPYAFVPYFLSQEQIGIGRMQYQLALATYVTVLQKTYGKRMVSKLRSCICLNSLQINFKRDRGWVF